MLIDPETLATLPKRQFANGLAEAVKTGMIADAELSILLVADALKEYEERFGGEPETEEEPKAEA